MDCARGGRVRAVSIESAAARCWERAGQSCACERDAAHMDWVPFHPIGCHGRRPFVAVGFRRGGFW